MTRQERGAATDKVLACVSFLNACMRRMPCAVIVRRADADVLREIREWFAETCGLEATREDPSGNWLFIVGNGLSRNKRRAESFPARFYVTERRMAARCKLIWHGHLDIVVECQENPPLTQSPLGRAVPPDKQSFTSAAHDGLVGILANEQGEADRWPTRLC